MNIIFKNNIVTSIIFTPPKGRQVESAIGIISFYITGTKQGATLPRPNTVCVLLHLFT